MSGTKRPLKVFLCHAHSDAVAVRDVYHRLINDGVDAWLDKEKLLPGQDWELEIRKAVRSADIVVVCLSKRFNQAGFRQKEVRLALDTAMEQPEGEIFIIPARLEECDTLNSLSQWQWVDLFEESGYRRLMLAFHEKAKRIGAHFDLPKQHAVSTSSDRSFVRKVVEELEKQDKEEHPSGLISIAQRFPAPGSKAEGITWDGTSIWVSDNSGVIFKVSPSGKVLDSVRSPDVTPQGLACDGSSFWVYTTNRSFIYQFQIAGEVVRTINSFRSPAQVVGGGITQDMAWDGEHLWYANQYKVYKLDTLGHHLSSFTFHKNVTGLDWDGSNLWIAYNDFPEKASLSLVNIDGDILETRVSPLLEVNGLAWADGYVWALGSDSVGAKPVIYKLILPAR
jgi:hypothetical protein